ncbi:UNVERIFIED_CONTAM: Importin subunit beta-1 [Sesamum radiatum]|uniref:Importin subunit beta-1 n=1 Tax=Sesamum radiatum TaxID=300843 RepID=A0AAW2R707_SESRA
MLSSFLLGDGLRKGQALSNLASIYIDVNKLDQAVDCFMNALNIKHTRAHQGLARVYHLQNQRKAAYDEMSKLIEKARDNASAYEKRSEYCDREMAKSDLRMATRLDPLRAYPYRYRAAVLMDDHKEAEAIAELTRAIDFKLDLQLIHLRAAFYDSTGDYLSAIKDYTAWLFHLAKEELGENLYSRKIRRKENVGKSNLEVYAKEGIAFLIKSSPEQVLEEKVKHIALAPSIEIEVIFGLLFARGKMALEITQYLLSAQSPDAKVRNEAETTLSQFRDQNLSGFLLSLSVELANDGKPTESRRLAASHTAAQVVAKIASIEVPRKEWPELVGLLLANMTQPDRPASLKQATLETLGYVCEEISNEDLVQDEVNAVLTAVVQGMNVTEQNSDVRLAATRALYNALDFARTNFDNEMERNYIMKVICDAALAKETEIRQAAFECLVSIASTYYEVLEPYMPRIFELTSNAVKGDEEAVALQAVEFWSSICDEELEIQDYEVPESGDSSAPHSHFIQKALPTLVPMLLETLLKQDEEQDQEDGIWNLAMAGGTCLGLVARTVGDAIVPLVMPFVETNISKTDWRSREAATYAFGSILEGPSIEKLSPMGYEDAGPSSSLLTPYLPDILNSLITTAERTDGSDSKLRSSAYETLNEGKARRFASLSVWRASVGPEFGKYMQEFYKYLEMGLQNFEEYQMDNSDEEMMDYGNQLRRSIFEAYSGILQGFKNSKPDLMLPHAPHLVQFLELVVKDKQRDESVTKAAVAVLGDLADALGSNTKVFFKDSSFCMELLRECLQSDDDQLKETATWTQGMLGRAFSVSG